MRRKCGECEVNDRELEIRIEIIGLGVRFPIVMIIIVVHIPIVYEHCQRM